MNPQLNTTFFNGVTHKVVRIKLGRYFRSGYSRLISVGTAFADLRLSYALKISQTIKYTGADKS